MLRRLPRHQPRFARRAYPSTLGHPGAGALDRLSRSEPAFSRANAVYDTTTREVMTSPAPSNLPGTKPKLGAGPTSHFAHSRVFPDHTFNDVVEPNADAMYSTA